MYVAAFCKIPPKGGWSTESSFHLRKEDAKKDSKVAPEIFLFAFLPFFVSRFQFAYSPCTNSQLPRAIWITVLLGRSLPCLCELAEHWKSLGYSHTGCSCQTAKFSKSKVKHPTVWLKCALPIGPKNIRKHQDQIVRVSFAIFAASKSACPQDQL